ncbi:MAG: hypothetical protein OMM_08914 [Candidatus Magnetoglobus multicellularis str. Araruama]|uniref:CobQ/CobB/MinD/ParA nucleotide binding domain-containing protein n=1 Tax=Candidatus Magnetoglobus multicellularis str. Araruama TaxID=890399 RepID=A0A1V1P5Z6_9BACT|nr:MAG: hypothetical protein OMM_08914 [Candidatus Magnetoglobus multicellularis str. Araruama]
MIVTEPTLSGMHDLKRVAKLANFLKVPGMLCINKFDLNTDMSEQLIATAKEHQLTPVGKVPYDPAVTQAMVAGKSPVDFSESAATSAIRQVWQNVSNFLDSY